MTIQEALDKRIPRIRKPKWFGNAYLRLPLLPNGEYGPWAELYDDAVQKDVLEIRPGSQRVCVVLPVNADEEGYEAYTGPVSEFEKDKLNYSKSYVEQ